jgi:hypothetical protein
LRQPASSPASRMGARLSRLIERGVPVARRV